MYALYFIATAAAASIAAVVTAARAPSEIDIGALGTNFGVYVRAARQYVNTHGSSPSSIDQMRSDPAILGATRDWNGAKDVAEAASWSLQSTSAAGRDVCVEVAQVKSAAALVRLVESLPPGAYASGSSCAAPAAPGSVPAAFPATVAFRTSAIP